MAEASEPAGDDLDEFDRLIVSVESGSVDEALVASLVRVRNALHSSSAWRDADSLDDVPLGFLRTLTVDYHISKSLEACDAASGWDGDRTMAGARRRRLIQRQLPFLTSFLLLGARIGFLENPEVAKLCAASEENERVASKEEEVPSRLVRLARASLDAVVEAGRDRRDVSSGSAHSEAVTALSQSAETRRAAAIARFQRDKALQQRIAELRLAEKRALALEKLEEDGVGGRGSEGVAGEALVSEGARRERMTLELVLCGRLASDELIRFQEECLMLGLPEERDEEGVERGPGLVSRWARGRHTVLEKVHAECLENYPTGHHGGAAASFEQGGDPSRSVWEPARARHDPLRGVCRSRTTRGGCARREAGKVSGSRPVWIRQPGHESCCDCRAEEGGVMRAEQLAAAGLEDDVDKADAAAEADREWDDWRDAHPRGMGRTKRV
jgi:hypothetical protein